MTRPTRDEAVRDAGGVLAAALAEQDALPPRQAAERAHRPGGPSVEELEDLIRAERGLAPKRAA